MSSASPFPLMKNHVPISPSPFLVTPILACVHLLLWESKHRHSFLEKSTGGFLAKYDQPWENAIYKYSIHRYSKTGIIHI